MNAKKTKVTPWPMAAELEVSRLSGVVKELLEALRSAERCLAAYEREGANNIELSVVREAITKHG
jgi:hypothetical protein